MTSRRRAAIAVGVSVGVHGALFVALALWVHAPPVPPPPPRPFNVQIVELPPLPPPKPAAPASAPASAPPAHHPKPAATAKATPRPPPPRPAASPSVPSAPSAHPSAPLAADVPRAAPILIPHDVPGGIPIPQAPGGTQGHLIRNDEKQHPTPEEIAQQDAHARANVQTWVSDDLARARVADGSVDTFFSDLRHAFEAAAKNPPPFKPKQGLLDYRQSWQRDAEEFGKDGTLAAGSIPTGEMRDFENHHDPIPEPGTNAERIMNGLAGTDLRAHASEQVAGGALVAVVEIRQAHDGKVQEVSLRKGSGDPRFDAFVLASARSGAQKAPTMPDHGAGIHPTGTRSVWAFQGTLVFKKSVRQLKKEGKSAAGIAARTVTSLLGGGLGFDETRGELDIADGTPSYRIKVALLAVY